jgi:hypothetical protein
MATTPDASAMMWISSSCIERIALNAAVLNRELSPQLTSPATLIQQPPAEIAGQPVPHEQARPYHAGGELKDLRCRMIRQFFRWLAVPDCEHPG